MPKKAMGLALVLILLGSFSGSTYANSDRELTDDEITFAIERKYLVDRAVVAPFVDVETSEGVVTLAGTVTNLLAQERAVDLARGIRGVRSVVDNITVIPPIRTDEEIEDDVQVALREDPAADAYEIEVACKAGAVTLSGTVESWQEKQVSIQVAKSVPGVRKVKDSIVIAYAEVRPDTEIKADIEARMRNNAWIHDSTIDVRVRNGQVTLTGSVGSVREQERAYEAAWVAGVKGVNAGDMTIDFWPQEDHQRDAAYVIKPDDALADAVQDALLYDPRVSMFEPEVSVENGVVTLTGTVTNLRAKRAAAEDARNTVGVWRVMNYLKVRSEETAADERVAERARAALGRHALTDDLDLTVRVSDGTAYLAGNVPTIFEKTAAENVVSGVIGVIDVENLIAANASWRPLSDWELKQDVEAELFWNMLVDSDDIDVRAEDGVVTLTGIVGSWWERRQAENSAYEAGATLVDNNLKARVGPVFYLPQ